VNFIDVYHRIGLYPLPRPFIPGMENVGIVEAVGARVTEVAGPLGNGTFRAHHTQLYATHQQQFGE